MKANPERLQGRRRKGGCERARSITIIGFQIVSIMVILGIQTTGASAAQSPSTLSPQRLCMIDFKSVEVAGEAFHAFTGVFPGGTLPAGYTVTPGSPPRGVRANSQTLVLTGTVKTVSGGQAGPWLRVPNGYPYVPHSFQIGFTSPTAVPPSLAFVENVNGTATIPAVSTYDLADCLSVKHKPHGRPDTDLARVA